MPDYITAPIRAPSVEEGVKMLPTFAIPVGLAEDFDIWMEAKKRWTWYRSCESTTSKSKQSKGGSPSVRQMSSLRRTYLRSSPSLAPSSSTASSSKPFSTHRPLPNTTSPLPPANSYLSSANPPLFSTELFNVHRSEKGGFGAFATKDIEEGTIVMAEKPLFRAAFMSVFCEIEKLTRVQRQEYRTLYAHMELSDSTDLSIFMTNRFETAGGKGGIFMKSSRFNHACHPHATCSYRYDERTDTLTFTACNPIKTGEEITISYTSHPSHLKDNYGFFCDCPQCPSPKVAARQAERLRGPC